MSNFQKAYAITNGNEGGYHNATGVNSADKGGETFKGIARKFWPKWKGWAIIDSFKGNPKFHSIIESSLELNELEKEFYKSNFWDVNKLDQIDYFPIQGELFDTGVNMGVGTAAKFFQEGLNLLNRNQRDYKDIEVDGGIGNETLGAYMKLNQSDKEKLFNLINIMQGERYLDLCRKDKSQEVFLRGWLNRVQLFTKT